MSKNRKSKKTWIQKNQANIETRLNKIVSISGELPVINHDELVKLAVRGDSLSVSQALLKVLQFYTENTLRGMTEDGMRALNNFVTAVFTVFTLPSFVIPKDHVMMYAAHSHIFSNVVAMSMYETTDACLHQVLTQENNLGKVCFLYTIRNKLDLPIEKFFDVNPQVASRWFISALAPASSPTSELLLRNMKRFYKATANLGNKFIAFEDSCHVSYFASSYVDEDCDAIIKPVINKACQAQMAHIKPVNNSKDNKIALVTSKWFPNSAVCKSARPLIERLFGKYHVTLVHTGFIPEGLDTSKFDDVIYLKDTGVEGILNNDFKMIYFADIGMTPESVLLSNMRLAPIQVMSYGHPASTFGSEIDYFIGGEDVELIDKVQDKYTERMVLISGMGCIASWPNYQRKYNMAPHDDCVIQAVWGPDKYFNPSLMAIKRAFDRFTKPARLHFYPSISINRNNALLPFARDLRNIFGDYLTLWTEYEYFDYMESSEKLSDMALNSPPPFGGFNTVVEAMYLDIPVLNVSGDTFRTMVGGELNKRVGLDSWNTKTLKEWEDRLVEIVNTGEWRDAKEHLKQLDKKTAIFSGYEPEAFERAIDYLMECGDQEDVKKNRKPLIIH